MQIGAATVESSMELPPKIKNGTDLWPRDSTSGYISKETQNPDLKYMYVKPYVHCSIIFNSQDLEATQVPTNRQLNKEVVHIYNGILLSYKKNEILPFQQCRWT